MLAEAAKPVALALCMAALCAVFYTAFLGPVDQPQQQMWDTLTLLSLAAGLCAASGMLFLEDARIGSGGLLRTLPMQLFLWALGVMTALFVASWYLETYCVFFRDVRRL